MSGLPAVCAGAGAETVGVNIETVRLIGQDIRQARALLTAQERWARSTLKEKPLEEAVGRIEFFRSLYHEAERRMGRLVVDDETGRESTWPSRASEHHSSSKILSAS